MTRTSADIRICLDRVLDDAVSSGRLVGGAVAVSRGGEHVYEGAAGLADGDTGAPFRPDTIVR
jgi:CubicO group peptidase (beta-lactamase class C family)